MEIAEAIFQRNPMAPTIVSNVYWPLIYNDLLYVAQYWNTTSYDLWEVSFPFPGGLHYSPVTSFLLTC